MKDMYASSDSQEYAENMLIPLVKKEIAKRKDIRLPSETEMLAGITGVLEDISDALRKYNIFILLLRLKNKASYIFWRMKG